MSVLRPYQTEIVTEARSLMRRGVRSILIQSPTGSGKTLLTAHMLKTAAEKGMASWFVVHRRELVKQSIRAFADVGVRHGVVAAGFMEDPQPQVQICSVQTLSRRYEKLNPPRLIVWDESHHVAASSWSNIFGDIRDAYHIGLTATPARLDGTGLGKWFGRMIKGPSVAWLIANKYLAPYRMFAPSTPQLAGVHTRMGDFVRSELVAAVDRPTITGDAINEYRKRAIGKRAVVFCCSVEHSKHVVSQFNAVGIPAAHVDGETDVLERDAAIRRFERGETRVLSNVELFGEGFDLPALEVAILLRPTQSLGLYLQQVGRVLRPFPGKDVALILDHAGNVERHGLPDEEREWSLEGRHHKAGGGALENGPSVRVCPRCFAAQRAGILVCGYCAHVFKPEPRTVEHVDGDLVEVDAAEIQRRRKLEQGRAQTLEELVEIGKQRGYKRPYLWAKHIFGARQAKKLQGGRV